MSAHNNRYMSLALMLGRRGLGQVWPNPAVGCVIVKDGRIVGRGRTAPGGRPHAETEALAQAGGMAAGACIYVTLEPCAHQGGTPPCAGALIKAGVARVVAALEDPDARVSGKGFAALRQAGIEVVTGVMADQAARDLQGFLLRIEQGRPLVTLKLASSFDGRIATTTGQSQWITGAQARRHGHGLRACHDAVMVGAGTARTDDPMLSVRDMGQVRQPVRIVASKQLDLPMMSQLAMSAKEVPLWLCHGPDADAELVKAWEGIGARMIRCDLIRRQLDMASVLTALGDAGLTRVLCEGGGGLAASLLAADLVDEMVGYSAGVIIGGDGVPGVAAMGLEQLANAPRFTLVEARAVGNDVMHRWGRERV
ncbi:Diaminohydroxyphosphoribosylaminopyrimidine deaminase / 5-amino-6-(5-phosphoribosylamino)uracil reductase [hydrothermal vent metagenome]|uniref:Diaminohydroxyphosphoribosylaminopyrimidine deaminase / 5-amino-6-(5-phosphoribosylamino)uracil reductase n=1 Tax=hydrothermal vent metagenome TaxID=652676 RepID=A0A3B0S3J1_9ZZZZ